MFAKYYTIRILEEVDRRLYGLRFDQWVGLSSWYETSVAPERLVDPSHPPESKRGKSTLAAKARVANHHHHHHHHHFHLPCTTGTFSVARPEMGNLASCRNGGGGNARKGESLESS